MRLLGFVLLIAGFLLCVSIVWAALGFLMMGFGLICLLIAERNRKRAPNLDVSDPVSVPPIDAALRPDEIVARQAPAVFLEPTFAAASSGADFSSQLDIGDPLAPEEDRSPPIDGAVVLSRMVNVGDRRTQPPPTTTRSSEFDRIRTWRTERDSSRSEPEFRDFVAPVEPRKQPPASPARSVSAEAVVPPPIAVAPAVIAEPKVVPNESRPEIPSARFVEVKAERSVLFDDADDLADLFNKFDLGKDEPAR